MNTEMITTEAKYYTAAELARRAGVSRVYLARLCRQGKLPARKIATVWIISEDDGAAWLSQYHAKHAHP